MNSYDIKMPRCLPDDFHKWEFYSPCDERSFETEANKKEGMPRPRPAQNVLAPHRSAMRVTVTYQSPIAARRAVYTIGRYFKREFKYDSEPYPNPSSYLNREIIAYLWVDTSACTVVGACAFEPYEDKWMMGWVWIHPYFRGHGILSASWPYFLARFGDFELNEPISNAMKSFLSKQLASPEI